MPLDRRETFALVVLAASIVVGAIMAFRAAPPVGFWDDDLVYLCTSKAIATGAGYRHIELPGQPWQTKYPPAFPAMLAMFWRAGLDRVISGARILNVILASGSVVIAYVLFLRAWRLTPALAAVSCALCAVNFYWAQLAGSIMSEHLYGLLSLAALLVVELGPAPGIWKRCIFAGLLASLATLTRSIGVTLIAAIVLSLCLRRQWKGAVTFVAVCALVVVPWLICAAARTRANAQIPQAAALRYHLDYGFWMPHDSSDLVWLASRKVLEVPFELTMIILRPPDVLMEASFSNGPIGEIPLLLLVTSVVWCVVVGLRRSGRGATSIYLMLYTVAMLAWAFPAQRFIVPILPIILAALVAGLSEMLSRVAKGVTEHVFVSEDANSDARIGHWAAAAGIGLLCIIAIASSASWMRDVMDGSAYAGMDDAMRQRVELVRQHTSPDAVVATTRGGWVYLNTGRRTVPAFTGADPIRQFFPSDRPWRIPVEMETPASQAYFEKRVEELIDYYDATRVTDVLVERGNEPRLRVLWMYLSGHSDRFLPLAGDGAIGLVRFDRR